MNRKTPVIGLAIVIIISIALLAHYFPAQGITQNAGFMSNKDWERSASPNSTEAYDLAFSTYFGGGDLDIGRDVYLDELGNVYITGGTYSVDFPTTIGPSFNNGPCSSLGSHGRMDVFVAKFGPNGNLIWSRLIGGPCYDRAYAIEIDSQGYVLVAGRAGEGFPVTPGAFQTTFQGIDAGPYGWQNAFVAKLSQDGSAVEWASYAGVGSMARDLAVDDQDDIYLPLGYLGQGDTPPPEWFTNAFQPSPQGGKDCGAIKINSSGTQVLWATWLGGSSDESEGATLQVDENHNLYLGLSTESTDIPTTAGAHDNTFNGGKDYYVARLSPDGSNLVYGTYLGGSGNEDFETHSIALDGSGNLYVSIYTSSTNFPTTQGVVQPNFGGGQSDIGIAKFSPTGALLASTYFGGSGYEEPEGTDTDASGNLYTSGRSESNNFPVSANAYQPTKGGNADAVIVVLSADLSELIYGTYLGGPNSDGSRTIAVGSDDSIVMAGGSTGSGWPTMNPYQANFEGIVDAILAKFSLSSINPTSTPTQTPSLNPTSTPTQTPSINPTSTPTQIPSINPTPTPTHDPRLTHRTYLPFTIYIYSK